MTPPRRRQFARFAGLCLCLTLLGASSLATAQDLREELANHPPAQRAAALTQVMQEKLSLSDAQVKALLPINEKAASQVDEVVAQYQGRDLRQRIRAINQTRDQAFKAVLEPAQFTAWQTQKRDLMKAAKERR